MQATWLTLLTLLGSTTLIIFGDQYKFCSFLQICDLFHVIFSAPQPQ